MIFVPTVFITRQPHVARPMAIATPPTRNHPDTGARADDAFPDGFKRQPSADGVGHIVRTVRECDEASTDDLQVDEDPLDLQTELRD